VAAGIKDFDLLMAELGVRFLKQILEIDSGVELLGRIVIRILIVRIFSKKISFEAPT
jgi:hypothetical protein